MSAVGETMDIVLANASVFDGVQSVEGRRNIGIRAGRIVAVDENELDGQAHFDLGGQRVLPGLVDSHVHLFDFRHADSAEAMSLFVKDGLPARLREFLAHGVTTIKSVGDPTGESLDARRRIRSGELIGPRLFVTGKGITAPGGHPAATVYRLNGWYRALATGEVDSPDQARDVVAGLAEAGVDAIKLLYQGACRCAAGEPPYLWRSKLTAAVVPIMRLKPKVLEAAIGAARARGLPATVHTFEEGPAIEALEAGADGIEHGVVADRFSGARLIDLLLSRRASYVPTLWVYNEVASRENLARVARAGARVVLGTDSFVGYGDFGINTVVEAERMAAAGMEPSAILRAATSAAAEHLRQPDLGRISPGAAADIVVYDRDPIADIAALRSPRLVVAAGRIVCHRPEA